MIRELPSGAVSGIPALLLNEGIVKNFDVIVLLGENYSRYFGIWACCIRFRSHYETGTGAFLRYRILLTKAKHLNKIQEGSGLTVKILR